MWRSAVHRSAAAPCAAAATAARSTVAGVARVMTQSACARVAWRRRWEVICTQRRKRPVRIEHRRRSREARRVDAGLQHIHRRRPKLRRPCAGVLARRFRARLRCRAAAVRGRGNGRVRRLRCAPLGGAGIRRARSGIAGLLPCLVRLRRLRRVTLPFTARLSRLAEPRDAVPAIEQMNPGQPCLVALRTDMLPGGGRRDQRHGRLYAGLLRRAASNGGPRRRRCGAPRSRRLSGSLAQGLRLGRAADRRARCGRLPIYCWLATRLRGGVLLLLTLPAPQFPNVGL